MSRGPIIACRFNFLISLAVFCSMACCFVVFYLSDLFFLPEPLFFVDGFSSNSVAIVMVILCALGLVLSSFVSKLLRWRIADNFSALRKTIAEIRDGHDFSL